jgi:hypothetical protein
MNQYDPEIVPLEKLEESVDFLMENQKREEPLTPSSFTDKLFPNMIVRIVTRGSIEHAECVDNRS